MEHSRRAMLVRQRNLRKKRPKECPETMLEGLEHYLGHHRGFADGNDVRKQQSVASKALGMLVYIRHLH